MKQNSSSVVEIHCRIHRNALAFKTLSAPMKDQLAIAKRVVNFVKANAANIKLFAKLCKGMDCTHETLLFRTFVR